MLIQRGRPSLSVSAYLRRRIGAMSRRTMAVCPETIVRIGSGDLDQVALCDRTRHRVLRTFAKYSKVFWVPIQYQPVPVVSLHPVRNEHPIHQEHFGSLLKWVLHEEI